MTRDDCFECSRLDTCLPYVAVHPDFVPVPGVNCSAPQEDRGRIDGLEREVSSVYGALVYVQNQLREIQRSRAIQKLRRGPY